jgi:hypothetical protein
VGKSRQKKEGGKRNVKVEAGNSKKEKLEIVRYMVTKFL